MAARNLIAETGADSFETGQKEKLTRSLVKRLEKLGHSAGECPIAVNTVAVSLCTFRTHSACLQSSSTRRFRVSLISRTEVVQVAAAMADHNDLPIMVWVEVDSKKPGLFVAHLHMRDDPRSSHRTCPSAGS